MESETQIQYLLEIRFPSRCREFLSRQAGHDLLSDGITWVDLEYDKRLAALKRVYQDRGGFQDAQGETYSTFVSYQNELSELSANELSARVQSARDHQSSLKHAQLEAYTEWSQCSCWTLEEAVVLSMDREPRMLSIEDLRELQSTFPFAKKFLRRFDLANRAKVKKLLDPNPAPGEFLDWAEPNEMDIPEELASSVRQWDQKRRRRSGDYQHVDEALLATVEAPRAKSAPQKHKRHMMSGNERSIA